MADPVSLGEHRRKVNDRPPAERDRGELLALVGPAGERYLSRFSCYLADALGWRQVKVEQHEIDRELLDAAVRLAKQHGWGGAALE